MSNGLLTSADREEALSIAYVSAVAAGAGYTTSTRSLDRDGIDIQFQAGGDMRPTLDAQLKATVGLGNLKKGVYRYPLKRSNYDKLIVASYVPRILIVLALPKKEVDWLNITPRQLIMRRCAFWVNLRGMPSTQNAESVTISIDPKNLFDVAGLQALMAKAGTGVIT